MTVPLCCRADGICPPRHSGWPPARRIPRRSGSGRTGLAAWPGPSRRRAAGARRGRAGCTTLPGFIMSPGRRATSAPRRRRLPVPEHAHQQLAARLAVAVLAGQRAAIRHDQIGGPLHETAVVGDAFGLNKGRTGSGCARSPGRNGRRGSASDRRVAEFRVQLAQVAQVVAEPLGRTAESSQPSNVSGCAGRCAVAPSPASRACHSSSSKPARP